MADELGDVAFTALVAAVSLGHDPRILLAQVAAGSLPGSPAHSRPNLLRAAADGSAWAPACS